MTDYVKKYAEATNDTWAENLKMLPDYMVPGLVQYIVDGVEPGDFLAAIVTNDLFAAVERADDQNAKMIPEYVRFLYNYAPMGCQGSKKAYREWINQDGVKGW